MDNVLTTASGHPYSALDPDLILSAVEQAGYRTNGRLQALNSYENRVYQIGLEDEPPLVAKFYRPGRWSAAAILEEHAFLFELDEQEIPVVAPLRNAAGESLLQIPGFLFCLYPRRGGRSLDISETQHRQTVGRLLGRVHACGAAGQFSVRPRVCREDYVDHSVEFLRHAAFIPDYLKEPYHSVTEELIRQMQRMEQSLGPMRLIRLHGDCHPGNILWTEQGPLLVDFDDARTGPAVQDLWMLLSGTRDEMQGQWEELLEAYSEFYRFDRTEIHWIEVLRAFRMIHYAAWLAKRWDDPAFPACFTWFNTPRYWEEHILTLKEQLSLIQEPTDFY